MNAVWTCALSFAAGGMDGGMHLLNLSGIIPPAGPHNELLMPACMRRDSDLPEAAFADGLCGVITKQVLVADVVGNLLCNAVHFIERMRKEGKTSRVGGKLLQGTLCLTSLLLALSIVKQANRINNRASEALNPLNSLLQREVGCIIVAIGDHQQNLLRPLRMFR